MFDSIKKVSKIEKEHAKRKGYSPTYLPIKDPMDNGVRFSNNTIFTQSERNISTGNESKMLSGILQKKLYPMPDETEAEIETREKWNEILENYFKLKSSHSQLNCEAIDGFIPSAENDWYGSTDHAASVNQFNAIITIKAMIRIALQELKMNEDDAEQLGWDEICACLQQNVTDQTQNTTE